MPEFARLARALQTLSAGNRTVLRASDEQTLLRAMCEVIVEVGGYRLAVVAYAGHDKEKRLRWMASVGIDAEAFDASQFTWDDSAPGQGAIGTAIRTGEAVVGRHILTDPAYDSGPHAVVRADARQRGYAAASAFPLRAEGQVIGALALAAAEPDAFDDAEVKLLGDLAADLAYGIGNLRTRARHRQAEATIARLAFYDSHTGLPNRTLLRKRLDQAIRTARHEHAPLALLHLAVGRLDEINGVLGYHAADALLLELSRRLSGAIGEGQTLARVGESAFALLLPGHGAEGAVALARGLVELLHHPVEVAGLMLDARVGIGIALFPGHAADADALIRRANAAVRQIRPGTVGYAVYTGGEEHEHTRRLALMGDLHRAIADDELQLFCQPQIDFKSGRVCGAEALVRWQHPLRGMISPVEFIPLAEQAGTVTPLTHWMLDAAFRHAHAWRAAGHPCPLAVNLSALDLYDPGLVARIGALFAQWALAPSLIHFELTESALMVDPGEALRTLARLKELGVQLFIDDYGTGQSSLSYLQMLPVDGIKIDQSFVIPMEASSDSAVIVRSTIELAHNLGLEVVAEGVESQAVWNSLAALGCDVAQGYFVSRPMPGCDLQRWHAAWNGADARSG